MDEKTQAAFNLLGDRVYKQVFFNKLAADYGIRPQGPADERLLLEAADILHRQAEQAVKTASESGSPFLVASVNALRQETGGGRYEQQQSEGQVKAAADWFAQDPELSEAALAYAMFLAGGDQGTETKDK